MPWAIRASSSTIGANQPMVSNVGVSAMTNEPPHIRPMVTSRAGLRPCTSANRPISQPPSGRKKNARANVAAVLR